jgi:hypothetical protein
MRKNNQTRCAEADGSHCALGDSRPRRIERATAGPGVRKAFALALVIAIAGLAPGCVAILAGTGAGAAVAYSAGRLKTDLSAELVRTEDASRKAIGDLKFASISESSDALSAVFIARTAEDTKVKIELTKVGDNVTKVEIRVGLFGNEATSLATLDRIKANLGI